MNHEKLRIGLDLDNTLISYDRLFLQVAVERGLLPTGFTGSKRSVRDAVRLLSNGELAWRHLQAQVYGPAISGADAAVGALEFIRFARASGAELSIVSHKTTFSNLGTERVNLRDGAREWLRTSGMVGRDAVPEERVYFEDTREEKIARITALRCTHFIDDLEEVFNDPAFPVDTDRLLLTTSTTVPQGRYRTFSSFHEIARAFATT